MVNAHAKVTDIVYSGQDKNTTAEQTLVLIIVLQIGKQIIPSYEFPV